MGTVKEEMSLKMLCNACLCIGTTIYQVTDERLKRYYLNALKEIPICNTAIVTPNVCTDCKALLQKSYEFREQVKDSYRILMTYTSENFSEHLLTDVSRPPRLRIEKGDSVDIKPISENIVEENLAKYGSDDYGTPKSENRAENQELIVEKLDLSLSDCEVSYHNSQVFVKEEMKIEEFVKDETRIQDSGSDIDADFDIPLIDLKQYDTLASDENSQANTLNGEKIKKILDKLKKRELKRNKKNEKERKKKKKKADDETAEFPNIITIQMTYEEMLKERQKELERDSYKKADFRCETCILGFKYNKSYKKHLMSRHSPNIGKYTCPICKTVLATVESFSAHYKRHMKRYQCSLCQKRTMDLKSMQQHYYSIHAVSLKQYKCGDCGKISNSVDSHRYHLDTHKSRLQCSECDKTFRHRGGLLNHRVTVHEAHNKFPCTFCNKVFRWKNSLKRHMPVHDEKKQPGTEEVAQCLMCRVTFASMASYKRHMANSLQHVTKQHFRFICDHCNNRFADKTKLRDHIEEKHLHKTYQCKVCLKTFMNRVNLDQHMRNVHRGRPNNKMCHHCGKGFPTKSQLDSHIRTHTGERPFICEFCPSTFSQHSNLYKHNRQVHFKRHPPTKKRKDENQIVLPTESTHALPIEYPVDIQFV